MLVCLKYCLFYGKPWSERRIANTYDNTLEKSAEGDITKLSALADHDIKCWILGSSSMLLRIRYWSSIGMRNLTCITCE